MYVVPRQPESKPDPCAAMAWAVDVVLGAFASGVNLPTLVLLNIVLGSGYSVLLVLLGLSFYHQPALVPHVLVMLLLATGLWVSINWFILEGTGLVDPEKQKQELLGGNKEEDHDLNNSNQQAAKDSQPAPNTSKQQKKQIKSGGKKAQ